MNTIKHTPGPWHIKNMHGIGGCREICAPHRKDGLAGTAGLNDDDQDAANARLIAAAPELLEALKTAEAALSSHPGGDCRCDADIASCRVAIAKAEGRS